MGVSAETMTLLNYSLKVEAEAHRLFAEGEIIKALTIVMSANCNYRPLDYISDVLAQCGMPYLRYREECERYGLLAGVVYAAYREFFEEIRPTDTCVVSVRDLTINAREIAFMVQLIDSGE